MDKKEAPIAEIPELSDKYPLKNFFPRKWLTCMASAFERTLSSLKLRMENAERRSAFLEQQLSSDEPRCGTQRTHQKGF